MSPNKSYKAPVIRWDRKKCPVAGHNRIVSRHDADLSFCSEGEECSRRTIFVAGRRLWHETGFLGRGTGISRLEKKIGRRSMKRISKIGRASCRERVCQYV